MMQYLNIESDGATQMGGNCPESSQSTVRRYDTIFYRVEIAHNRCWVYKRSADTWEETSGNPYNLPLTHFDLINQRIPLTVAVQTYELATGRFDLRDALTGANQ